MTNQEQAVSDVVQEVERAATKHPRLNSAHEGFAVILEEVDELKAEVWKRNRDAVAMRTEAVQVAAMAIRFLTDVCTEKKPTVNIAAAIFWSQYDGPRQARPPLADTTMPTAKGEKVARLDYHGDVSYYVLGHVDGFLFNKAVMRDCWNDLMFCGLGEPEHVWMIRRPSREHLIVPAGTPGCFAATWAQREEL